MPTSHQASVLPFTQRRVLPFARRPRRVAVISAHTSPLEQPGTGDAGGLNVYVLETSRHLAAMGVEVDVFTRATAPGQPTSVEADPGVRVFHVQAGPLAPMTKEDLPSQLCGFAAAVLRQEATGGPWAAPGPYDVVHSHYWLSGQVGWLAADRWGVPLVHTPHTLGRIKNETVADGDRPEPNARILGEEHLVSVADRHVVNTADEARALVDSYHADPSRIVTVNPGVDLSVFRPTDRRPARLAHPELAMGPESSVLLFVGRIQPLKAPDVLIRAAAEMMGRDGALRDRLVVVVAGGPSGSGVDRPDALADLVADLGLGDVVRFAPPMTREALADLYRSADLVVMPSRSESFGLVALEAQACGTPVVAAEVGGLTTAVADGVSGVLVPGHDPRRWAEVLSGLLADPQRCGRLAAGAVRHSERFSWSTTAEGLLETYRHVLSERARAESVSARRATSGSRRGTGTTAP